MKLRYEAVIECSLMEERDHRPAMWAIMAEVRAPDPGHPQDILEDAALARLDSLY